MSAAPATTPPALHYLISARAVTARLGIHRTTLHRWAQAGAINVYKLGGQNRYDVREIDALVTISRVAS